ncbi:MAG TPA: hypothetical protein DEB39_08325, partial [Planctomycetaceae bacterium]|nr:hypothetical protein [Planctomycetaceae bacterium]
AAGVPGTVPPDEVAGGRFAERQTADFNALQLPNEINELPDVQAVFPYREVRDLLDGLIGNVQFVLIVIGVLVIVVAGIGMMVSIYNSMNERRHEIAVMRALGAQRTTVMIIILLESILLSLGGGALGVVIGHCLTAVLSPFIAAYAGVVIRFWDFQWTEWTLIPGLILLASIVGYLPAVIAYRTDVGSSLSK